MKAKGIIILVLSLLLGIGNAMAQEDYNKAQESPKKNELVLGRDLQTRNGYDSYQSAYKGALNEARRNYPQKNVAIRNLNKGEIKINGGDISYRYTYTVVELPNAKTTKLVEAIGKATSGIEKDCSFALDKITISDESIEEPIFRSQIINALKEKGYKVIAKEQLEKLYKEQQGQQSGIYNAATTVNSNNFTAAGYYISISISTKYIQIQVVNISTGEYEGNVTEAL